jgi:excisionase family DNA binding protein
MTRPRLYTLDELADEMRVRREWLRQQAHAGVIPGRKIAGHWRFTESDIEAALETFARPATKAPVSPAAEKARPLSFTATTARRVAS